MAKPNSAKAAKQEKIQLKKEEREARKMWYWRLYATISWIVSTLWLWFKMSITIAVPLAFFPIIGVIVFKWWFGVSAVETTLAFILYLMKIDLTSGEAMQFAIYYRMGFYTAVYVASVVAELFIIQVLTLAMEKQKMDRKIEAAEALELKSD